MFGNPRQEGGHSDHSKPVGTHRRILKQLVDSVGFVNKSGLKMEHLTRPQRSSLANSDCDSDASSASHVNAHTQSESNSSLDQVSSHDQQFHDSIKPSHLSRRGGEPINLSGPLLSDPELQLPLTSNSSNSFRSSSSDSSSVQPPISVSIQNSNHKNSTAVAGRQSTSPSKHSNVGDPKSIRQVGSDGFFHISSVLNPVTSTCLRSGLSTHQNLHQSRSHHHQMNAYKPSHERVQMTDQQPAIRNNSPMLSRPQIYSCSQMSQHLPHIPLHIVRNPPLQTRIIHYNRHANRSPIIQQQHPKSLRPEYKIYRIANKSSHFNNSAGRIPHLNLQKSPILVPIGESGSGGGGGSMRILNTRSSTCNRFRSNDQTIYVKPVDDMSSSHSPSTVTSLVQSNPNAHHCIPVVVPISTKLTDTKSNYVSLTEYSKNAPSRSSESKLINNRPLNIIQPQNSANPSLIPKKKRGRPPKTASAIHNTFISSVSHEIDNNGSFIEACRSHNTFESPEFNHHRYLDIRHQSFNNSTAGNIHNLGVSATSSSSNQVPSSSLENISQLPVSYSLTSPCVRVVLNCPYNAAKLFDPAPCSPMVTTINMTGFVFKSHLMNESDSVEPLSKVSIFHDHQPGICSQFFSPNHLSSRDDTDYMRSSNLTKPSQINCTDHSQESNNNGPCDSHNSENHHLISHQTDTSSLEAHETRRSSNIRFTSTARARSRSPDSTFSQMSNSYTLSSEATCSHPDTNVVPTSRRIDIRKNRIQRHEQLRNVKRNPNFVYATTALGNDPHSNESHPQRFDGINYDEIENIDCEEKNLSNSPNIGSSFLQNDSANLFDDLRKKHEISGSGGSSTQNSLNTKFKRTNIFHSVPYIPDFKNITSKNRWVTLGSPIKRTIDLHGQVFDRTFFSSIKLDELILSVGDSVLLKSNHRSNALPYVGILAAFWNDVRTRKSKSRNGMKYVSSTCVTTMITVLWYYRPYQTDLHSYSSAYGNNELFVSKHMDDNPASCIIEKCHVLSYSKYCRYRSLKALKSLRPSLLADTRPFSCLKNMEDLSELLQSDLQVFFSSRLVDAKTGRVLKRVPSIFISPEVMRVSPFFHSNMN